MRPVLSLSMGPDGAEWTSGAVAQATSSRHLEGLGEAGEAVTYQRKYTIRQIWREYGLGACRATFKSRDEQAYINHMVRHWYRSVAQDSRANGLD